MSQTEDEDDDDDEEMPEEAGNRSYDTSARDGRFRADTKQEDNIQIHTDDDEIPQGQNKENKIRRSSRNTNKPNRYGSIPHTGNFWG